MLSRVMRDDHKPRISAGMSRAQQATVAAVWLLLMVTAPSAFSATKYVSDELEIQMRAGKSTQYRIVRMLKSGTPLTVMEDSGDGYTRVKVAGVEGWVLSRFLMDTPSAREQLAAASEKAATLEIQNNGLREELTQLSARQKDLQQEVQRLTATNNRLNDTLTQLQVATADEQRIIADNGRLKEDLRQQSQEVAALRTENSRLRDRKNQQWFLYGAGIVVLGFALGLVAPNLRRRKRASWDSF